LQYFFCKFLYILFDFVKFHITVSNHQSDTSLLLCHVFFQHVSSHLGVRLFGCRYWRWVETQWENDLKWRRQLFIIELSMVVGLLTTINTVTLSSSPDSWS